MQHENARRTNVERSESMRASLLGAARTLFIEKGYADTATPDIVAAAGVTRGALYHHFADKLALFRAVVERESALVATAIEQAAPVGLPLLAALAMGGRAFLDAMEEPGRTRILLLDGPAVLGRVEMERIDEATGGTHALRSGLAAAMRAGELPPVPLDALTSLLSSAFDRAALEIAAGAPRAHYENVLQLLVGGLAGIDKTP